jgi:hypothetical protein
VAETPNPLWQRLARQAPILALSKAIDELDRCCRLFLRCPLKSCEEVTA